MATIQNIELRVSTNRPENEATISVTCDVEFTELEVNAMDLLGLAYTLRCQLLDMDMLYAPTVAMFVQQHFPRVGQDIAKRHEHVVFETEATMRDLHVYVFGKDTLLAEVTLTNDETGTEVIRRSEALQVDLRI
jgi:hypothetical protein